MANLGFGSSFLHGSNTYLGERADNRMIDVVSFLNFQQMIPALAIANPTADPSEIERLFHLGDTPRIHTGVQAAMNVTEIFRSKDVSEWAQSINDLDIPQFRSSFTAMTALALSVVFPQRDDLVEKISIALVEVLEGDPETLTYLPIIDKLTSNLSLDASTRFVLLRQVVATLFKFLYAFLWQEQTLPVPIFLEDGPNRVGAEILPTLVSLFNFISGFEHTDQNVQASRNVYPGDETCRLQPHAKWHEVSSNGLLDLAFTVDCIRTSVAGQGLRCATLTSIDGMDSITLDDARSWAYTTLVGDSLHPVLAAPMEIALLTVWYSLDQNFDEQIDYEDIEHLVNGVENWIQFVQDIFDWWNTFMTNLNNVSETAACILDPVCIGETTGACVSDSMCLGNDPCILLSCGLQESGEACLFDSDCVRGSCGFFTCGLQGEAAPCVLESDCTSGRCEWDTFTCQPKLGPGAVCNEDNDCMGNVCTGSSGFIQGVCGKQPDGSPCLENSDCQSGSCEGWPWEQRTCYPKVANGGRCNEDLDCQSGRCEGWYGFATCHALVGRGSFCNEDSDCVSSRCNLNWWGSGSCA